MALLLSVLLFFVLAGIAIWRFVSGNGLSGIIALFVAVGPSGALYALSESRR